MQAPNVYPFPQPQLQQLPRFQYAPTQIMLDRSAPRVDPLQTGVAANAPLPVQHYNIHSARRSDSINCANNYAYYYHHPDNNDKTINNNNNNNTNNNNNNKINNINNNNNNNHNNPALPAASIPVPNGSLYRNRSQFPSAPQRLLSIVPDAHMAPNIPHYQLNNIQPQMHVSVPHNIHFQQIPTYNNNSDNPVESNENELLDNINERYHHELNKMASFSKHFENDELTTTPNDADIQCTIDELSKLKYLSNSPHFKQNIAIQNYYSLQNHIATIENRLTGLLHDRHQQQQQQQQQQRVQQQVQQQQQQQLQQQQQQQQQQLQQQQQQQQVPENTNSSSPSNKIKLPSLHELTKSISTQDPTTTYTNKRHASDSDTNLTTTHHPLYHRHTFLSTSSSSSSPSAGSVPLQKLQVPRLDKSSDAKKNLSSSPFNSITYIPSTTLSPTVQTQLKNTTTSNANTKKKNNRGRPRAIQRQPTLTTSTHFINNSGTSVAVAPNTAPTTNNNEKETNPKKIIEFCFHCGETETPEWRKGPYGTRTLCNACGLFYRKVTKKFGSKSSNLLLRYRRAIDLANDRRIPDFITIPNRFIHDMDKDQTLDSEYNTILQ